MSNLNATLLKVMHVLFWVIFIGLCIKTGAILFSFIVSLFVNPGAAKDLYLGLDLSSLYQLDQDHYFFTVSLLLSLTGLKAFIALLIIRFFLKFRLSRPFDTDLSALFMRISYVSLCVAVFSVIAQEYSKWLVKMGAAIPIDWAAEEVLFFTGVIYILALIFEKGAELQTENDLTV